MHRRLSSTSRALLLCGCLPLLACGGGGNVPGEVEAGPGPDLPDVADAGPEADGGQDPGCVRCDLPPEDGGGTDDAPADPGKDAEGPADPGQDPAEDASACPGGYLCPCTTNTECWSGLCVNTMEGHACTKQCGLGVDCPPGWGCENVAVGAEPIYACVLRSANLCRPCKVDADCLPLPGGGGGNLRYLCIAHGDDGSFCGSGCETGAECPGGFECVPVSAGRDSVLQCRPAGGAACPCTDRYREEGALTTCRAGNEFGTCTADRTCDTPCAAATPAPEACNRRDDDCNGGTDEGTDGEACDITNAYGTCPGLTRCLGGQAICEGTAPAPEVCGNDLDEDCDGQADGEGGAGCGTFLRDDDRDRFGVAGDTKCLCAPEAPWDATAGGDCDDGNDAVKPTAVERCNGVDDDCDGSTDEDTLAECFPTVCSTVLKGCLPACAEPGDCQEPWTCDGGACRKRPGQPCQADGECAGGFCTDGYCCATRCDGTCERCDGALTRGACTALAAGTDPDEECDAEAAATCGRTGECSGLAACALWAPGTVCAPSACDSATVARASFTCDGSGACTDNGTADCSPFSCDPSTGLCRKACIFDRDCDAGFRCAEGVCLRAEGQGCTGDGECASGFCADGTCCFTRCGGTCEACDLAGSAGICMPVPEGTDPEDECEAEAPSTCGRTGTCSGLRFCARWAAGTSCTDPACATAGSADLPDACDGEGACLPAGARDCFPYACNPATGACRAACSEDAHCQEGHRCREGACRREEGAPCQSPADCASGNCVDGLCCDTACQGPCEACDLPGGEGACTLVPGGQDPDGECADEPASSCGTVGTCSGLGACRLFPAGTVCLARACASLYAAYPDDTCDGDGACRDGGLVQCFPYLCDPVTGACRDACATGADCQAGYTCTAGACRKADGEACQDGAECARGHCVDGVCCDGRCEGPCESCALSGTVGRCTAVPAGEDPDAECDASGPLSCGTTGACSGQRACALAPGGTVCQPAACADGTTAAPADLCNGAGDCIDQGTVACGAYGCDAVTGACRTTCAVDGDCQAGYVCSGTTCRKDRGQGCATDLDCASGFCTDRVCCEARCDGDCESCNQPLRAGFCDAVPDGTDPDGECPLDALSSCGRDGQCSGQRSCRLHAAGTTCQAAACVNTVTSDPADTCDGNGLCFDTPTADCQPYTCDGATGACRVACTGAGDCAPGYACADSVCRRGPGQNCDADLDCASGFCTDGTCCRTRCQGTCESCDQPGRVGYCDPVPQATDPDDECSEEPVASCGLTGLCSGARACAKQAVGTVCNAALCVGAGTSLAADLCDGSGTCIDAGSVACDRYTCDPATGLCRTACSGAGDCAAGYECALGQCLKARGSSCFLDGECASGFCTDGTCCTVRCDGPCETCRSAGREGFCDAIPLGTDPDNECPDDGVLSCDRQGACSGNRTCSLYASGTVCAAPACQGDASSLADLCDGAGTCTDSGTQACLPYTCNGATGLCRTGCSGAGDCQAGYSCVGGLCRKDAGQPCTTGAECSTGTCCGNTCRDLTSDVDNCGACGTVCQQVNGTNACVASACVPSCNNGFGTCDGNANNGCEQPLNTLSHCVACNTPCAREHAAESCSTGSCVLGACDSGWATCDGNDANGCELDLATDTNSSGAAEDMGAVRGDTGSDAVQATGRRSRWFKVLVTEGDSNIFTSEGLSVTVNLTVPAGTNYDLYLYGKCSGRLLGTSATGGSVESVTVRWDDQRGEVLCIGGCEDQQEIWAYVKWASGAGCGSYTLVATGNTSSVDNSVCGCDSCPFD